MSRVCAPRIEFDEFLELFMDHSIEVELIQIDDDVAEEVRRLNKIDTERKNTIRREFRRTGGLYHHTLKDDEEYCWVLVFINEEHDKYALDEFEKSDIREAREKQLQAFLLAGMALKTYCSADNDEFFVQVGAPQRYLEFVATLKQEHVARRHSSVDYDEHGVQRVKITRSYEPYDLLDPHKGFIGAKPPWVPPGVFVFKSKARIQLVEHIMKSPWDPLNQRFGGRLCVEDLKEAGVLLHCFPLHLDRARHKLRNKWGNLCMIFACWDWDNCLWNQPCDEAPHPTPLTAPDPHPHPHLNLPIQLLPV